MPITLIMRPDPRSRICGSTARMQRVYPRIFKSKAACHCSSVIRSNDPKGDAPALLTSMSARPSCLIDEEIATLTASAPVRSARTVMAWTPCSADSSLASERSALSSLATNERFTPSCANARAVAAPIPRLAPVTIAVLPARPRFTLDFRASSDPSHVRSHAAPDERPPE